MDFSDRIPHPRQRCRPRVGAVRRCRPLLVVLVAACGGPHGLVAAETDGIVAETGDAPATSMAVQSSHDTLGLAFERAAAVVRPSVVSVTAVHRVSRPRRPGAPFGIGPPSNAHDGEVEAYGLGSGVVLDTRGHILTNNHVVAEADEIRVRFPDDRETVARVIGTDPKSELAVLLVDVEDLTPAVMGDSSQLHVGQWVLAVGSPFGLEQTVSAGIVSAVGRGSMGIAEYADFIQTDAAINPGNSGGPLIDLHGHVVGINTAIASRTGGSHGIGFAIPANMAEQIAEQLIEEGRVVRGFMGVLIGPLDQDTARNLGIPDPHGVLVRNVLPGGPADRAGLRRGDVVVERDGVVVEDATSFRNEIAALDPGETTMLQIWRDGRHHEIEIELGEQ
jgi:serine protease Do